MRTHRVSSMAQMKTFVSVALMIGSVVLLIVLQFFWLKNSYEKAYFDLRRESSTLFTNTVFNLRDSLFMKNIEPVPDSADRLIRLPLRNDSIDIKYHSADSPAVASEMHVYISGKVVDSTANFLKPLASSIHKLGPRRSFVIRMEPDTLSRDTIALHLKKALAIGRINQPFYVQLFRDHETFRNTTGFPKPFDHIEQLPPPNPFSDTLVTDRVKLNPRYGYVAVFKEIPTAIIKRIAPQILFSVLLTTAIIASFIIMYRSLQSQRHLNDMKNHFISNITHELKTPVATVSVALEALKNFNVLDNPEKSLEYLNIAQDELNRLTLMTDKILKAAVYEHQGITFTPENVNVDAIIDKVLSSLKLIFENHKLNVHYLREGDRFDLNGSSLHLTNVIYNLIDNAIKYGNDNSTIEIKVRDSGNTINFSVRDNGVGIAREYQQKIFEKFFRIPTGDVHNIKGYGLGLSYVFEVVRKHHGKIDVESEPGKGSVFTIHLPKKLH